jgi:hypothetical protein
MTSQERGLEEQANSRSISSAIRRLWCHFGPPSPGSSTSLCGSASAMVAEVGRAPHSGLHVTNDRSTSPSLLREDLAWIGSRFLGEAASHALQSPQRSVPFVPLSGAEQRPASDGPYCDICFPNARRPGLPTHRHVFASAVTEDTEVWRPR